MDGGTIIPLAGEKCRQLWKNRECKLNTSLQFVHFAVLALLLKDFEQALRSGRETGYKVENRNITISPITATIQSSKKTRHPIGA